MIGAGVFSTPATLASTTGPVAIVTYIFVMIAVWLMALSLSRVTELFPQEGSFYNYAKQWGGHTVGVIAAGSYIIGLLVAMGLLTQIAGIYIQAYIPFFSSITIGIGLLIFLVTGNIFGARLSQAGQMVLICTTVFPIIATSLLCLTKFNIESLGSTESLTINNVLTTTKLVIFGFFGFEAAASLFSVVKNPKRTVPQALTYSITLVGLLYLFFIGSIILATPTEFFSHPKVLLSTILLKLFPTRTWIITLIHCAIISAITGTLHSMIWSASTLICSFSRQLKKTVSSQTSVLIVGLCIATTCLTIQSTDLFFSLTAVCLVLAYALAICTLLFLPKEWKSGRNIITVCGLLTAGTMMVFAIKGIIDAI